MSDKIFDNSLVAIRKSKVTLTLNKPGYIGMRILDLSKVLMYQFHYDYIKNKHSYNSKLSFIDKNSAAITKLLILVINQLCQNSTIIQTS